jgi:hypothetical protein
MDRSKASKQPRNQVLSTPLVVRSDEKGNTQELVTDDEESIDLAADHLMRALDMCLICDVQIQRLDGSKADMSTVTVQDMWIIKLAQSVHDPEGRGVRWNASIVQ